MPRETTRVQMELPKVALDRLNKLKEKTEAASYAEVTKNAYRVYARMVELSQEGYTLCVKDKKGNVKEIELFI